MKRLPVAMSLAVLFWACGDSPTRIPAAPTAPAPATPVATYTLSGTVLETTYSPGLRSFRARS
jgi:hypothetical protein